MRVMLACTAVALLASGCSGTRKLHDAPTRESVERNLLCQEAYRSSQRYLKALREADKDAFYDDSLDRMALLLDIGARKGIPLAKDAFSCDEARRLAGLYDSRVVELDRSRRREMAECLRQQEIIWQESLAGK